MLNCQVLRESLLHMKQKQLLAEYRLKKLKTFDSSYFIGKSHFEEDGTQNYLLFQPINRYFIVIANTKYISSWISKGLSDESIKPPVTCDNSLSPLIDYLGDKISLKFQGSCLKQPKRTYTNEKTVNIYIAYELGVFSSFNNDPTLKNSRGSITKNAHTDKYQYLDCGTGLDRKSSFSFPGGEFGQNVIIFEVDMGSSVHVDNKKGHFNS